MKDIKIGIRIQTAGKRQRWTNVLLDHLKYENNKHFPTIAVIQTPNLWQSCKHCHLSFTPDQTHTLILQDDILLCRDFLTTVYHIVSKLPNNFISFFSNNDNVPLASMQKKNFLVSKVWFMAQAYLVPVGMSKHMIEWIENNVKQSVELDDNKIATYLWYNKIKAWNTVPSLVEHLGWNETTLRYYDKNKIKNKTHRMAKMYVGFENSGMDFNWKPEYFIEDNQGTDSQFCDNLIKPI